jgi:hypothetical protein
MEDLASLQIVEKRSRALVDAALEGRKEAGRVQEGSAVDL